MGSVFELGSVAFRLAPPYGGLLIQLFSETCCLNKHMHEEESSREIGTHESTVSRVVVMTTENALNVSKVMQNHKSKRKERM